MKVSVRQCRIRDYRWLVDWKENGKRKRSHFKSKRDAELFSRGLLEKTKTAKAIWSRMTQHERDRLIFAYWDAKNRGHDLHELISRSHGLPAVRSQSIGETISELIEAKKKSGASLRYCRILEIVLKQFSKGRDSMMIDRLTLRDVEAFLDSKRLEYRSTLRSRLSTLFMFAIRRGYRSDNPCQRLEPLKITRKPPAIFTAKQFSTAFETLSNDYPQALGWFVLTTLAGLRPEEALKTKWSEVHFDEGWIRIEAQTTKVRQRRIVYPRPEVVQLLKKVKRQSQLPLSRERHWKALMTLRNALKFDQWPKDITRHTAASYWLAENGSAAHVSEMLGNSEGILKRDYKALVTKAQSREFWELVEKVSAPAVRRTYANKSSPRRTK